MAHDTVSAIRPAPLSTIGRDMQKAIETPTLLNVPTGALRLDPSGVSRALRLSVVVPTFNESRNIAELVRRLSELLDERLSGDYEIIVVDDNSPDRTWELALTLGLQYPALRVMRRELELRRDLMYPPFARLAMVRIEGAEPLIVRRIAEAVAKSLAKDSTPEGIRVLGPAPAPIERIKQRYRWQVMIKSRELKPMRAAIAAMRAEVAPSVERDDIFLAIDIDPVRML